MLGDIIGTNRTICGGFVSRGWVGWVLVPRFERANSPPPHNPTVGLASFDCGRCIFTNIASAELTASLWKLQPSCAWPKLWLTGDPVTAADRTGACGPGFQRCRRMHATASDRSWIIVSGVWLLSTWTSMFVCTT